MQLTKPTVTQTTGMRIGASVPAMTASASAARARRRSNLGANALITVASLVATAAGWVVIAHDDQAQQAQQAMADTFTAQLPIDVATRPLILPPIPTLAPEPKMVGSQTTQAQVQAVIPPPALRQVDAATAPAIVQQAQVAPVARAPIARTRSSRRRTR